MAATGAGPQVGQTELGRPTAPRMINCYSVFDHVFPACGFTDLTDGMYDGDPGALMQSPRPGRPIHRPGRCGSRSRLLDIGCGYGRILRAAETRGRGLGGLQYRPSKHGAGHTRACGF